MRYENLTVTENYTMIAKNLKKHFTDEPLAYMILEFLYDEALKFNSFGLLTEDMSFYCPVSKIIEMFEGNVSSKTVFEKIKIIEKRNFIKKTSAKILKRPNYYRINFEKIKEIAKDKKITVCDEIPQEPAEETPALKSAETSQEAKILEKLDENIPTLKDTLKSLPRASKRASKAEREGTIACGEFKSVFLTPGELSRLYERFGRPQTLAKLHYLDGQIASGVKKYTLYKNHYATLRNWLASDSTTTRPKTFQEIDNDRAKEILAPSDTIDVKDDNIFIAMAQEKNIGRTR